MMDMKRIYNILLIMILSLFLLPLGGCFDSDINRSMYEADGEEMQRENHIVGATLKGMQGLVIPTREHLYQFMDAMAGGAYGGYLEGIVDTWVMKFSTFNPEQGWLKSPFADPIKDMYPQYRDMMNKTDDPVALAFGKILRVCIMHRVTDIYGPIPYSKMMDNDNSGEDLAVAYDSQEQVYTQMLKELEEAEVNYELKKKDYENAVAALKVFQIEPEDLVLGQPLIVRSPIAGEIVTDRIVIGQYIKEDAEPVAVIANLNKVWVAAHVKEKDMGMIQSLDSVEIRLVAMPDLPLPGKIYHVSEMLDEDTRSVEVLIECDNSAHLMKPAMYGTVKLCDRSADVIRIPTSAILQEEEGAYVLVSLGNNAYRKQKVTTSVTEDGKTVILTGLNSGDTIVTTGAFYLLDAR